MEFNTAHTHENLRNTRGSDFRVPRCWSNIPCLEGDPEKQANEDPNVINWKNQNDSLPMETDRHQFKFMTPFDPTPPGSLILSGELRRWHTAVRSFIPSIYFEAFFAAHGWNPMHQREELVIFQLLNTLKLADRPGMSHIISKLNSNVSQFEKCTFMHADHEIVAKKLRDIGKSLMSYMHKQTHIKLKNLQSNIINGNQGAFSTDVKDRIAGQQKIIFTNTLPIPASTHSVRSCFKNVVCSDVFWPNIITHLGEKLTCITGTHPRSYWEVLPLYVNESLCALQNHYNPPFLHGQHLVKFYDGKEPESLDGRPDCDVVLYDDQNPLLPPDLPFTLDGGQGAQIILNDDEGGEFPLDLRQIERLNIDEGSTSKNAKEARIEQAIAGTSREVPMSKKNEWWSKPSPSTGREMDDLLQKAGSSLLADRSSLLADRKKRQPAFNPPPPPNTAEIPVDLRRIPIRIKILKKGKTRIASIPKNVSLIQEAAKSSAVLLDKRNKTSSRKEQEISPCSSRASSASPKLHIDEGFSAAASKLEKFIKRAKK